MSWSEMTQMIRGHEHRPQFWLQLWNNSNSREEFNNDLELAISRSNIADVRQTRVLMIRMYQEIRQNYAMIERLDFPEEPPDPRVYELKDTLNFLGMMIYLFDLATGQDSGVRPEDWIASKRAQRIAELVRRHEGDPMVWIKIVYGASQELGKEEIQDMEDGINLASPADRSLTASNLQVSLRNHEARTNSYRRVNGSSADRYQLESAETGRQFLIALIEQLRR